MKRVASPVLLAPRRRGAALLPALGALSLVCLAAATPTRAAAPTAPAAPADSVDLVVASTTDTHGHLRGWDYFAGQPDAVHSLARAATVVDSLRAADPGRVLLVDAGDLLQGTPMTYVAARVATREPHPVAAAMNAMGYDAAAIGNHEFNYGVDVLDRAIRQARFPFLAANARRTDGHAPYRAWTMVARAGVKVALVGGTTPGSMVWDRDHLKGRVVIGDIVPAVRDAARAARAAGADVVVAVLHSGLDGPSSYDTVSTRLPSENVAARVAHEAPGVDVVIFGHSHRQLADTAIAGALVMQPKNWAESVGAARLSLVRRDGRWQVVAKRGALVRTAGHAESPAVLAATDAGHRRAVTYANSVVGSTPVAWHADSARVTDTPIVDLVGEVMRRTARADLAATAAFSLEGGFDAGPITVAEIARLYPYENTLRAVRVSGAQLRAFLEHSARYYRGAGDGAVDTSVPGYNFDVVTGADYVIDVSRPVGQRVTALAVRGRPVTDTDTFTLALNNYRQTGGGGFAMLAGAPVVYDAGQEIRQLLIDEVKRRGTLRPADYFTRNWRLAPESAVARAYEATGGTRAARMQRTASVSGGEAVAQDTTPTRVRKDAAAAPARRPRRGPRTLRVIAINDFHGALEPRADAKGVRRGGAGPLAAAIAEARAGCRLPQCTSVLLDGGDEFQGTPTSNLAFGRPITALFRELGVAASALGNHEFDWGVDTLRARIRDVPYAVLGANVRTTDGQPLPWLRDDTLIVRDGVRIGVVGVADPATPSTTRALNVRGLRFDPVAPAIDARARLLRARGADVVVVVAHLGGYCDRTGEYDPGVADTTPTECRGEIFRAAQELREPIAAIVSGHTHSKVATTVNGIPLVQSRSSGRALSWVDVPLDRAGPGTIGFREVVADSVGPVPPAVARIVERANADVAARVSRQVATLAAPMPRESDEQYALGNAIADAQRWAGKGDVAIMNNGGIRTGLPGGAITFGNVFEVQPFANTLYRLTVKGSDLKAYLPSLVSRNRPRWHVSGLLLTYDSTRTGAERLVSATRGDGGAIVDDSLYTVILNDFLVTGGDGLKLAERAVKVEPTRVVDVDALVDWLAQRPQPVQPPTEERIRAVAGGTR